MSTVIVRRATGHDVDLVVPLFALYRQFYGRPLEPRAAADFLRQRLERGESVVLVAELGEAIGFTQLYPMFSSVRLAPVWVLNDLFVQEQARGRGVATALLDAAERCAAEAGAIAVSLATARSNTTAQALYERQGYRLDEHYQHYEKTVTKPR